MKPYYHDYLVAQIRRFWGWSPERAKARRRQLAPDGRSLICQGCALWFAKEDTQTDHIEPMIPLTGFDDWSGVIRRGLDVTSDGIQILCLDCHKQKTKAEGKERTKHRRSLKKRESSENE